MATITLVVECDAFQHGTTKQFVVKCLAIACGETKTTYTRYFDTMGLLTPLPDALRNYQFQSEYHGWPLASTGLTHEVMAAICWLLWSFGQKGQLRRNLPEHWSRKVSSQCQSLSGTWRNWTAPSMGTKAK